MVLPSYTTTPSRISVCSPSAWPTTQLASIRVRMSEILADGIASAHRARRSGRFGLVTPHLIAEHQRERDATNHIGENIGVDQKRRETEEHDAARPVERSQEVA